MIHPEKQRGGSEVLKELVYQNLLLYTAGGSHEQRCKTLRAWKVSFNCIQNDPLDVRTFYMRRSIPVQRQSGGFQGGDLALFNDSTSV